MLPGPENWLRWMVPNKHIPPKDYKIKRAGRKRTFASLMTTRPLHSAGAAGETNEQQENKAQVTDIPLGTRAIPD